MPRLRYMQQLSNWDRLLYGLLILAVVILVTP
jgi:hypothetical protein